MDLDSTARDLAGRFRLASPGLAFSPVPRGGPRDASAVDGGSGTVLDAGGVAVVAWRAAVASSLGGVTRVDRGEIRTRLVDAKEDARTPVDALRASAEAAAALDALAHLPPDGLLLLDGAMLPDVAGRLRSAANGRLVVAVAKSTSETLDGVPLLAAARSAARRGRVMPPYAAAVGRDRYVVRWSPAQDRLFLVTVVAGDPQEALGALAALGTNPGAPGYPYLLALAHQAASLSEEEQEDVARRILDRAASHGADARELELAFHDYHEDLDLGA